MEITFVCLSVSDVTLARKPSDRFAYNPKCKTSFSPFQLTLRVTDYLKIIVLGFVILIYYF